MLPVVLGAETPLGLAFCERLQARGRNYETSLAAVAQYPAGQLLLIDLRPLSQLMAGQPPVWDAALPADAALLLPSSYCLFSGVHSGAYDEESVPDVTGEPLALAMLQCEQEARRRHSETLILRLGAVLLPDTGLLHRWLMAMAQGQVMQACQQTRLSPVLLDDATRVLSAIVDQLSCCDTLWGLYHYAGRDWGSEYDVAEATLAAWNQYHAPISEDLLQAVTALPKDQTLQGGLLRDVFGIRPHPWRQGVAALVQRFEFPASVQ